MGLKVERERERLQVSLSESLGSLLTLNYWLLKLMHDACSKKCKSRREYARRLKLSESLKGERERGDGEAQKLCTVHIMPEQFRNYGAFRLRYSLIDSKKKTCSEEDRKRFRNDETWKIEILDTTEYDD